MIGRRRDFYSWGDFPVSLMSTFWLSWFLLPVVDAGDNGEKQERSEGTHHDSNDHCDPLHLLLCEDVLVLLSTAVLVSV